MKRFVWAVAAVCLFSVWAGAEFALNDDGGSVMVLEDGKAVLTYHYALVTPPEGVDARYRRMGYVHPLYGLDGEVMTQDFPGDHFHHRGVFWAWPKTEIGGKLADVWALDGIRQVHEEWVTREAGADSAVLSARNVWVYDDAPDSPKLREHVTITVHPAEKRLRAMDFDLVFENIGTEEVVLRGATDEDKKAGVIKGYGGFCFRPDSERKPMHFTCAKGVQEEDVLRLETPWTDVSFAQEAGKKKVSGVAIFEHPDNPGYPHPGWILRNYGFLGQSWPHTEPYVLAPGAKVELRYRLVVHRGNAKWAKVEKAFERYVQENGVAP